ncbi:MAG: helix-turn-helix domain-containing protein [Phyllobacteriaceae bacterium]|nr:helix-turn-helix domain-containing protein [Phyllobacteriaceae bacterium]
MTAKEAAAELNVSVATLYAYVSRGIIRSEAKAGTRARRYSAADIRMLLEKNKIVSRKTDVADALSFGAPLLESEITFTDGKKLYFRGRDVSLLAQTCESLESVAMLIWDCKGANVFAQMPPEIPDSYAPIMDAVGAERSLVKCQALLPLLGERDVRAYDLSADGGARAGAIVLRLMTALISGTRPSKIAVHDVLSSAWRREKHAHLLRSALILAADHELNASTFTVRVASSAGASLYHAVAAGLATLQGARHGGEIERTYRLLREILDSDLDPAEIVAASMRRGDVVPGFGHPLYPSGDPRARTLCAMMDEVFASEQERSVLEAVAIAESIAGKHLNFDGALAVLTVQLGLPASSGLYLLAIGRVVGWVGHAIEQYRSQRLIRPRARYVGLR